MTAARVLNFDALSVPVEALDHAGFQRWVSSDAHPEKLRAAFAENEILRAAYARAGIPEYWMVDARGDELEFQILRLEADGYLAAGAPTAPQESRIFSRTFRLERSRNRIGRWDYRLIF